MERFSSLTTAFRLVARLFSRRATTISDMVCVVEHRPDRLSQQQFTAEKHNAAHAVHAVHKPIIRRPIARSSSAHRSVTPVFLRLSTARFRNPTSGRSFSQSRISRKNLKCSALKPGRVDCFRRTCLTFRNFAKPSSEYSWCRFHFCGSNIGVNIGLCLCFK